jgi:hypothetical protein
MAQPWTNSFCAMNMVVWLRFNDNAVSADTIDFIQQLMSPGKSHYMAALSGCHIRIGSMEQNNGRRDKHACVANTSTSTISPTWQWVLATTAPHCGQGLHFSSVSSEDPEFTCARMQMLPRPPYCQMVQRPGLTLASWRLSSASLSQGVAMASTPNNPAHTTGTISQPTIRFTPSVPVLVSCGNSLHSTSNFVSALTFSASNASQGCRPSP